MLRNLDGFWVTLQQMAMADKWAMDQKRSWVRERNKGLRRSIEADRPGPNKAKKQEVAEKHLKMLEFGRDKLTSIAETVHDKA